MSEIFIFVSIWFKRASLNMLTEFIFFIEEKCFSKMRFAAIKSILYYLAFVFFRNVSVFLRLLKYIHGIYILSLLISFKSLPNFTETFNVHWLTTSHLKYLKPFRDSLHKRFLKPFYLFTTYTGEFHILVHPRY